MICALESTEMAVYAIHPESWVTTRLAMGGVAPPTNNASFHGRFQWHDRLGGFLFHGMGDASNTRSAVWVLRVQ